MENRINEIVNESMEKVLNEISGNKKREISHMVYRAIDGVEDNVRTFCILTGENPMGIKSSNKLNRNKQNELKDFLKSGHFAWKELRGKYGTTENPKMIFNITIEDAKNISLNLLQESFIFGRKEEGKVYFDLYFINKEKNDYDLVETKDYYENVDGNDYFTIINNKKKFSIPFEYFNESICYFNNFIEERKQKSEKYRENFQEHLNRTLNENASGYSRYQHRGFLYF